MNPPAPVVAASHQRVAPLPAIQLETGADPLLDREELDLETLVDAVLERNPSLEAMRAAWRAAAERWPQEVALDDPMLSTAFAPDSINSSEVNFGWMIQGSQKIPWRGKRQLRGRVAQAEAQEASREIESTRLRLTEAAKMAFFDYYLAVRKLEINAENARLLRDFRDIAKRKYEAAAVEQQDVLLAELEIVDLERATAELERMRTVAMARLNTLLHLPADVPLPAPPQRVTIDEEPPAIDLLQAFAVEQRPDLSAIAARIEADRAAWALACKEFYPDLEFMARYDTFWQEVPMRTALGVGLNLPLQQSKREAAVREAQARVAEDRAEYSALIDQIHYEVQEAHARLLESRRAFELYGQSIVPAAKANLEAAQSGYIAGKVDFLRLVQAQQQVVTRRERQFESLADYHRRHAELERAVGGHLPREDDTVTR